MYHGNSVLRLIVLRMRQSNSERGIDAQTCIQTANGEIVGGLVADPYWNWLEVEDLWVHVDLRK